MIVDRNICEQLRIQNAHDQDPKRRSKNLLFDYLLHQYGYCNARSLQARSLAIITGIYSKTLCPNRTRQ